MIEVLLLFQQFINENMKQRIYIILICLRKSELDIYVIKSQLRRSRRCARNKWRTIRMEKSWLYLYRVSRKQNKNWLALSRCRYKKKNYMMPEYKETWFHELKRTVFVTKQKIPSSLIISSYSHTKFVSFLPPAGLIPLAKLFFWESYCFFGRSTDTQRKLWLDSFFCKSLDQSGFPFFINMKRKAETLLKQSAWDATVILL